MLRKETEVSNGTIITQLLTNHQQFLDFVERQIANRHDAEEILQTAYVRCFQKGWQIEDFSNGIAWFYRLLRNAVIDHHRRNDASKRVLEVYKDQSLDLASQIELEKGRTACQCVKALIPSLQPEFGEIIRKIDVEGGDVKTVATALGLTHANARVRLHRARTALKNQVEKTCQTCAETGCLDCTCKGSI